MNPEKLAVAAPPGLPIQMVSEYLNRYRNSLCELHAAIERAEFEYSRVFGHRLKGTGGAYGFPGLTTIGAAIEKAADARDQDALREQSAVLAAYLERIEVVPS